MQEMMQTKVVKEEQPITINNQMKKFLVRLLVLVAVWEVIYIFLLKPARVPDAFLTHILTACVTWFLDFLYNFNGSLTILVDNVHAADHIQHNGRTILTIFDDCNGLELYLMYFAFLWLLPGIVKRKLKFTAIGIVAIFAGNILRCIGLYWVYINYRSSFDFNHHYIFTIMMYLIILVCWVFFTKKEKINEAG